MSHPSASHESRDPALAVIDGSGASAPLVEAKLAPPYLRRDVVPRDGIVGRLVGARDEPVIALAAPAGYGKTTVLALWRSREPRPMAWLTADEADADPVRFMAYLVAAIERATDIDLEALDRLIRAGASVLATLVPQLSTILHRAHAPLIVVLDDIHVLAGTPTIDALAMLIDYLPPEVAIAVAGRGDGGLPLARFRAAGRLLEVTTEDLAFDERESTQVAALQGRTLREQDARELQARTEGWPAAVYLATRRPHGAPPHHSADADAAPLLSGRDADIGDYLDAELLDGTTPRVRAFLLRTSVLQRMTGDLCDAVVGGGGSDRVLRSLAARNQLVVPLDPQRGWYRYHTLLREHLLDRLEHEPGGAAPFHRRAAAWYARSGRVEPAVAHLFAAGDPDAAAAAATGAVLRLYRDGREATIERWLKLFGDDTLRRHPYLAVVGALTNALEGRDAGAAHMADLAEDAEYTGDRPAGAEDYEAARATVRGLMARRGMKAAIAEAEAGVAGTPSLSSWHPISRAVLGALLVTAGDRDRGDAVLREVPTTARMARALRAEIVAVAWRALLAIEEADWSAAASLARDSLATVARVRHDPDAATAVAYVVAARVAMHRGEVSDARRHLAVFQVARATLGVATPWLSVRCLLEGAKAHLVLSDPAGARSCLQLAADILAHRHDLGDLPEQVSAMRDRIRDLPPGLGGASTLTPAEVRILRLLPTYLTAAEIAERLYVTPNTVRTQIQSLYGKLGATSRSEAVEAAVDAGLLEPLPVLATGRITST